MDRPFGSISAPQNNVGREPCGRCGRVAPTIVWLHRPYSDNITGEAYAADAPFCSSECATAWWVAYSRPGPDQIY